MKTAIVQAYIDLDVAALDRLYSDDFTVTDANGKTRTKADELAYVKSQKTSSLLEGQYVLTQVRVFGNIAVASGKATMKVQSPEGPRDHVYDSCNVFVKEDGRWRYAAAFTP